MEMTKITAEELQVKACSKEDLYNLLHLDRKYIFSNKFILVGYYMSSLHKTPVRFMKQILKKEKKVLTNFELIFE